MSKFSAAAGDVLAPILFMIFVGYQAGKYFDKIGLSIAIGLLIGFVVAMYNVWKLMKKLGRNDE